MSASCDCERTCAFCKDFGAVVRAALLELATEAIDAHWEEEIQPMKDVRGLGPMPTVVGIYRPEDEA